jgi:hypothetical protein
MTEWPYDPDGAEGSEGMRKFGMALLAKKVDETEDFPLAASEYVEQFGGDPIRLDDQRVVAVGDIFEYVGEQTFEDMVEFHTSVGDAMREGGYWDIMPEDIPN